MYRHLYIDKYSAFFLLLQSLSLFIVLPTQAEQITN